jgi:hypothetical protein
MFPFEQETAVLDACVLFPMLVRDVLLSLANADFFGPCWSLRIRDEWTRNLAKQWAEKFGQESAEQDVFDLAETIDAAFPGCYVEHILPDDERLHPVDEKDRHVVMTAFVGHCRTIVTFNLEDFARDHVLEHLDIQVMHPDDFVLDCIEQDQVRVAVAFKGLLQRKKNPKWTYDDLLSRLRRGQLKSTADWLAEPDIRQLVSDEE